MNQDMDKAAEIYLSSKRQMNDAEYLLFTKNKEYFNKRIIRVFEQIIRGIPVTKSYSCSDEYSIPFSIIELGEGAIKCLNDNGYPASSIDWNIDYNYGGKICATVRIESFFHGELDSSFIITFPINEEEFEDHIQKLKIEAEKREVDLLKKQQEEGKRQEELEKEQLKFLANKYNKELK